MRELLLGRLAAWLFRQNTLTVLFVAFIGLHFWSINYALPRHIFNGLRVVEALSSDNTRVITETIDRELMRSEARIERWERMHADAMKAQRDPPAGKARQPAAGIANK